MTRKIPLLVAICALGAVTTAQAAPGFGSRGMTLSSESSADDTYDAQENSGLIDKALVFLGADSLVDWAAARFELTASSGSTPISKAPTSRHTTNEECDESEIEANMTTQAKPAPRSLIDVLAETREAKSSPAREPIYFAF